MATDKQNSRGATQPSLQEERDRIARERAQFEADVRFFRSLKPKPSNLVMRRDGVYEAPPPVRRRSIFDIAVEREDEAAATVPGRRGAII